MLLTLRSGKPPGTESLPHINSKPQSGKWVENGRPDSMVCGYLDWTGVNRVCRGKPRMRRVREEGEEEGAATASRAGERRKMCGKGGVTWARKDAQTGLTAVQQGSQKEPKSEMQECLSNKLPLCAFTYVLFCFYSLFFRSHQSAEENTFVV